MMALQQLPGVAEVAMQSGRHAARAILAGLAGSRTAAEKPFRYRNLGTMASIARFRAVARVGPLQFSGAPAWALWLCVHLGFLTGVTNRVAALASWVLAFGGRTRPQRTITERQVYARSALRAAQLEDTTRTGPAA